MVYQNVTFQRSVGNVDSQDRDHTTRRNFSTTDRRRDETSPRTSKSRFAATHTGAATSTTFSPSTSGNGNVTRDVTRNGGRERNCHDGGDYGIGAVGGRNLEQTQDNLDMLQSSKPGNFHDGGVDGGGDDNEVEENSDDSSDEEPDFWSKYGVIDAAALDEDVEIEI